MASVSYRPFFVFFRPSLPRPASDPAEIRLTLGQERRTPSTFSADLNTSSLASIDRRIPSC